MTEHEENLVSETEGEIMAKEAADSPFGQYGRPFSDDPLGVSEFYYHDNPASNVGPYAGPNSYSINTVAPYGPPHEDEENPAQNVGPYAPPDPAPQVEEEEEEEESQESVRRAHRAWEDRQWFDGTTASIYARSIEAEHLRKQARTVGDFALEEELREQVEVLNKTAAEYDDSILHEALDGVPGGTVALEYDDLVDGGLVDVTSFLSTASHRIAVEASTYDWDQFKVEGARSWITQKLADNPGLIKNQLMAREAAVDYAKDKTMVLMDPSRRADIIDAFVVNAERYRRDAAARLLEDEEAKDARAREIDAARMAQTQVLMDVHESIETPLPGSYVSAGVDYDEDGYLNLGEDDGSVLYQAARDTVEASKQRDWEDFTTEGAREWFFTHVAGSPMVKYDDITYRAAKKYATDQAALLPDEALKTEIARAFTSSVEFLRQTYLHREASREVEEPTDELEDFFGEEYLW